MSKKKSDLTKSLITNLERQNSFKKQWNVSEQELKKLAANAMSDSLSMYGWGLKSKKFETREFDPSQIASTIINLFEINNLKIFGSEFAKHKDISQYISRATNFQTINNWSDREHKVFLMKLAAYTCLGSEAIDSNNLLDLTSSEIDLLGMCADKILLATPEKTLMFLGAKSFKNSVLNISVMNSKNWKSGLSEIDIMDTYIHRVLGTENISLDFKCFHEIILNVSKSKYSGKSKKKQLLHKQHQQSLILIAINQRIDDRIPGIKLAIDFCMLLRQIEHESIIDPKIDIYCTSLGQNYFDFKFGEPFKVGEQGSLKLAAPFFISVKQSETTNKTLVTAKKIEDTENEGIESTENSGSDRAFDDFLRNLEGLSPIGGMRGLLLWRGGQHSFDSAKSELCKILPSAIRTAWLVISGGEPVLGYLIDPLYRSADDGIRQPSVASNTDGMMYTEDIRKFPEVFPVFDWIQQSIDHVFNTGNNQGQSPDFLSNALLLLREADEMITISPRQTFACSMAAVEVCLGGKGGELSQRIVQRMSRLLINQNNLRTTAEKLFLLLYELRSKIVHGDMCEISLEAAVFMRYVASCVVFNAGGFSKTLARMGVVGSAKDIRSELDSDKYGEQLLPGVLECKYLLHLIRAGLEKPDEWKQFSAGF